MTKIIILQASSRAAREEKNFPSRGLGKSQRVCNSTQRGWDQASGKNLKRAEAIITKTAKVMAGKAITCAYDGSNTTVVGDTGQGQGVTLRSFSGDGLVEFSQQRVQNHGVLVGAVGDGMEGGNVATGTL